MSAKLVIIEGKALGESFPLDDRGIFEVGQSEDADLSLDDPDIVPIHLKIYRENTDFRVFDLSGRGFLVNGRRCLKHDLDPGDVIAIGGHALRFEYQPLTATTEEPSLIEPVNQEPEDEEPEPAPSRLKRRTTSAQVETRVELHAIKGNDTGKVFDLKNRPMCILGRGIATDITIWDIRCSRVHCRIDGRNNRYILSDMNSSNGTFINGARLKQPIILEPGDTIKIGATVLKFTHV